MTQLPAWSYQGTVPFTGDLSVLEAVLHSGRVAAAERGYTAEPQRIEGRAWSGAGPVTAVEVSADGGETWESAELGPVTGRLLAEMMTGETPFADTTPFAVERFG